MKDETLFIHFTFSVVPNGCVVLKVKFSILNVLEPKGEKIAKVQTPTCSAIREARTIQTRDFLN